MAYNTDNITGRNTKTAKIVEAEIERIMREKEQKKFDEQLAADEEKLAAQRRRMEHARAVRSLRVAKRKAQEKKRKEKEKERKAAGRAKNKKTGSRRRTTSVKKGNATHKPGPNPKSTTVIDTFNPDKLITPSDADIELAKAIFGADYDGPEPTEAEEEFPFDDETEISVTEFNMLKDLRAVYSALGGKTRLTTLLGADDKQFVGIVKELMKLETSLMNAKARQKAAAGGNGGGDQPGFFVVLKGLEDMPKGFEKEKKGNGKVDLKQIERALDPNNVNDSTMEDDIFGPTDDTPPEQLQRGEGL